MLDLGKLYIPTILDYNPELKKVSFRKPEYLSDDYINNLECTLTINFSGANIYVEYYCEDDTYLSENLELEDGYIATGDLSTEGFENIQKRVLEKLSQFMDDPQSQILEDYN